MKKNFLILIAFICQLSFAGEHGLTDIEGKNIHLKSYDHAIAGSMKDFVIFGNTSEESNLSELTMKKHGQIIKANFALIGSSLGGTIQHDFEGKRFETRIKFVRLNVPEQKIILSVNEEEVVVEIKAEGFANNHFINPKYTVTLPNGETFDYKMLSGQACYAASLHMAMLIVGAYMH